jgi:hypothetical protein
MPQRRFPRPWRWSESLAAIASLMHNALALAHVYGQAPDAIAFLDKPLTDNEASQRGAQMAQRENNDRNKHISRAAKSGRFSRSLGRLMDHPFLGFTVGRLLSTPRCLLIGLRR